MLRARADVGTQPVADSFHVTAAYVRAIEAGLRALPSYTVVGLYEQFGMPWPAASALVAIAGFLDQARQENAYRSDKLIELSRRLRAARPSPAYREFLDCLDDILAVQARPADDGGVETHEWTQRVQKLRELLDKCLFEDSGAEDRHRVRLPDVLNPLFDDLIERLGDELSLFPPHVNASAIQEFERRHESRILGLFGYVSDERTLRESSTADWQVLWSQSSPRLRILLPSASAADVKRIEASFKKKLAAVGGGHNPRSISVSQHVELQLAKDRQAGCDRALRFDFTTRSQATANAPLSESVRRFPNAWLYEMHPVHRDSHSTRWVGFLMDADKVKGYAVAIDHNHVSEWLDIFRAFWPSEPRRSRTARDSRKKS